jgi:hypothetical protein
LQHAGKYRLSTMEFLKFGIAKVQVYGIECG